LVHGNPRSSLRRQTKKPASHRSRPAEFRIPRFSWNFRGVVKPTKSSALRYIGAKTCFYASRKTTEAGVRRLPSANHHGIFKNIHVDQPLDSTETEGEVISLIRDLQALFKCGSFSMRSKLTAFIVPMYSSHGQPFWSLKINLLDANKQPTQTNFQLAAKQQIQTSNR
jgi:hypothetical protein